MVSTSNLDEKFNRGIYVRHIYFETHILSHDCPYTDIYFCSA